MTETTETPESIAQSNYDMAIDQMAEYDSADDAHDTYRDNAAHTCEEYGLDAYAAFEHYLYLMYRTN